MVDTVVDTDKAREWLQANPTALGAFDQKYGTGAAAEVLNGTYKTPEELAAAAQAADQQGMGLMGYVGDAISGLFRGPIGATVETGESFRNANAQPVSILDNTVANWAAQQEKRNGVAPTPDEIAKFRSDTELAFAAQGMGFSDTKVDYTTQGAVKAMGLENVLPETTTMVGGLTEGVSQFVSGLAMLGGASGFAGTMLKGAVIDSQMFEETDANLANLARDAEWTGPIIDAALNTLATNPDDPAWENKARNALVGGMTGATAEGLLKAIKFVAVGRKASTEIKQLGQVTDETAQALDEAHADIKQTEEARIEEANTHLKENPDGTFTDPDGVTYKPNGEKLDVVEPQAEAPVQTPDTPTAPDAQAPDNAPKAPEVPTNPAVATDIVDGLTAPKPVEAPTSTINTSKEELAAQAAPVETPVAPKAPVMDSNTLKGVLDNAKAMGDFDIRNIDDGGAFNFERMEGPVDAAKLIDSYHTVLSDTAGQKMGWATTQSLEEVTKDALKFTAEVTNTNVNTLIRNLNATETITRDLAAKIVAGKMALQSTGREITRLAGLIDDAVTNGKGSEDLERKLIDLMQLHAEVQVNVKGLQTSAARATSAGRIVTKDFELGNSLDRLSLFGGSAKVRQLAKQLRSVSNPAARAQLVRKAYGRKFMGVLNEFWINSILSGFKTHMLNITSNSVNLFGRPMEHLIGGAITGNGREMAVAMRTYQYLVSSTFDSIMLAAKAGWRADAVLDAQAIKFATSGMDGNTRAISGANLGVTGKAGTAIDIIGKGLTMSTRMLGAEDEFFKQMAYRSNLKANIVTDAARMSDADILKLGYKSRDEFIKGEFDKAFMTKIGAEEKWQELVLTGKVMDDAATKELFIKQQVGSANVSGSKYAAKALDEARKTTFTTPLKNGTVSGDFQIFVNKHPALRQVIPFIQTPMNIMYASWERTPALNLLKRDYAEAFRSTDPAVRAEARGKMAMGAAIYGSLTFLAMEGRITGGGPADPKLKSIWMNSKDWQPYSINVGTVDNPKWISYQRLDPWTSPFGIVADIYETMQMAKMADNDGSDIAAATIAAIGANITSKTYLQGISDMISMLRSDDIYKTESILRQRVASLVPYSGLLGQTAASMDDYTRDVRSYLDAVINKIPAMRETLPVKYDWLTGQPSESPEAFLTYINTKTLTPDEEQVAEINSEMRKLYTSFGGAERKISGITLTSAQYQEWNQLIGTMKLGGRTLQERLSATINSNRYNKDGNDYGMVTAAESHRVAMLRDDIARYRDAARRELMRNHPDLRDAVRQYDRYKKLTQIGRDAGQRPEIDMNNLFNQ